MGNHREQCETCGEFYEGALTYHKAHENCPGKPQTPCGGCGGSGVMRWGTTLRTIDCPSCHGSGVAARKESHG